MPARKMPARKMPAPQRDGTRFVDVEDLAKAERLILQEQHPAREARTRPGPPKPQFTLAGIMVVTFFVCLGLSAGGSWIPAPAFAGVMGFLAIASIIWTTVAFPSSLPGRVVWMGIAFAYFAACLVVLLQMLNR